MTITKEVINDMKKADTIVFRIRKEDKQENDYKTSYSLTIECVFEEIKKNGWVKPEERISHNGMKGNIFIYRSSDKPFRSDWVIMHSKKDGNIQALVSILKPNDELKITVAGGNNSNNLTENGLNNDELCADVFRPIKNKPTKKIILERFVIDHTISNNKYRPFRYNDF